MLTVVSWCDGRSPPVRAFDFPGWIRGIFHRHPAGQSTAAHTNTFQSLDGPDTHTFSPQKLQTHTVPPLTLTSFYTCCMMLQSLAEPLLRVCAWDCLFFCSPVTQILIFFFKTLSHSHWCSSKLHFICRKTAIGKYSHTSWCYRLKTKTWIMNLHRHTTSISVSSLCCCNHIKAFLRTIFYTNNRSDYYVNSAVPLRATDILSILQLSVLILQPRTVLLLFSVTAHDFFQPKIQYTQAAQHQTATRQSKKKLCNNAPLLNIQFCGNVFRP